MWKVRLALATSAIGVLCSVPAMAGDGRNKTQTSTERVEALDPFTNVVYIPDGADLSSIRPESVRLVKVADRLTSTADSRLCERPGTEPGGSAACIYTQVRTTPAYRVRYSYSGTAMA